MTGAAGSGRPPSVMKMSITSGGVKTSIFHPDGEDFSIGDVLDQLVTPLLIAAGYSQVTIDRGYREAGRGGIIAYDKPVSANSRATRVELPELPEGFEFVGIIADERLAYFSDEDLAWLSLSEGWIGTSSFRTLSIYAARIGSEAHKYALEHFPQAR